MVPSSLTMNLRNALVDLRAALSDLRSQRFRTREGIVAHLLEDADSELVAMQKRGVTVSPASAIGILATASPTRRCRSRRPTPMASEADLAQQAAIAEATAATPSGSCKKSSAAARVLLDELYGRTARLPKASSLTVDGDQEQEEAPELSLEATLPGSPGALPCSPRAPGSRRRPRGSTAGSLLCARDESPVGGSAAQSHLSVTEALTSLVPRYERSELIGQADDVDHLDAEEVDSGAETDPDMPTLIPASPQHFRQHRLAEEHSSPASSEKTLNLADSDDEIEDSTLQIEPKGLASFDRCWGSGVLRDALKDLHASKNDLKVN